jgi:response regulator RpfG family c-di-GMP phosphodiesterase/DNA-binding CsgD family transcriptional regulator
MKDETVTAIATADALLALAFMGDLSMGQPTDHSPRVAWLARRIAVELGLGKECGEDVHHIALLRWVGCTANATEVANVISDDVQGRAAMLALRPEGIQLLVAPQRVAVWTNEIRAIHCEVSLIIAGKLGLRHAVLHGLQSLFETWDGTGSPAGLKGDEIPLAVFLVLLAGDIDVFVREYGLAAAMTIVARRANLVYPKRLVDAIAPHIPGWMAELEQQAEAGHSVAEGAGNGLVNLALVADAIDLKLPWLSGYSRAVSQLAGTIASRLDLAPAIRTQVQRAALLHGLGRVAVPNAVWNKPGPLSASDWERVRLSPYWTARAATQIKSLEREAEIAAFVYERLDGSGYFRAARHAATSLEHRILPVAATWLALRSERPWRPAQSEDAAIDHLHRQASLSRFDLRVVDALEGASGSESYSGVSTESTPGVLSSREIDVLRCISRGHNNKAAARQLGVSPSTVRTHMESIFRKFECKSRAAATLKASSLGLL